MTGLRRTALRRRTELKRGVELRRTAQLQRVTVAKRAVVKQRRQQRDTGPSAVTKELLWERAGGRCEICGRPVTGQEFSRHHRRARGSGGTSLDWVNDVANLLLLCGSATTPDGCHRLVETQRHLAYANGWAISLHATGPATQVPALLFHHFDPVYLTSAGSYTYVLEDA